MTRDEHLAHVIREALQRSIEQQPSDPAVVERVAVGVGAALGGPASDSRSAEPDMHPSDSEARAEPSV